MKLKISTTFEGNLFDAYDVAELDVAVDLWRAEHTGTLSIEVTLDIQNRWDYEDESGFELPDRVWLLTHSEHAIEGEGGTTREFRLPLNQNLLDGLKQFRNLGLWRDEEAYELLVSVNFQSPHLKGEVDEHASLALRNPWM